MTLNYELEDKRIELNRQITIVPTHNAHICL